MADATKEWRLVTTAPAPQWEYLVEELPMTDINATEAMLDSDGRNGFELIQVIPGSPGMVIVFLKRPVFEE